MSVIIGLTIGLPGAGKSTFIRSLEIPENYQFYYIEFDAIEREILARLTNDQMQNVDSHSVIFRIVRDHALNQTRNILKNTQSDMNNQNRHLIIIDDNFFYASMRKPYRRLAREFHAAYFELSFNASEEDALYWNSVREESVSEDTIHRMSMNLEPSEEPLMIIPSPSELSPETRLKLYKEFWSKLPFVRSPESIPIKKTNGGDTSILHQLDLEYRSCSKRLLESVDVSKRGTLAKHLKLCKQEYMKNPVEELNADELKELLTQFFVSFQ